MQLLKPVTYSNESGRNPSLQVIDQIQISQKNNVVYIPIDSVQSAWNVLRKGQVCGEPWSAIVATISVALDLVRDTEAGSSSESILRIIDQKVDHLRKSRPTDGALFHSLDKLMEACHKGVAELDMTSWNLENAVTTFGSIKEMTSCKAMLVKVILSFGEMMIWSNSNIHLALGAYGSATIRDDMVKKQKNGRGIHLLTIGTLSNVSGLGYYGAASAPFSVVQALMERNFLPSMAVLDINSTFLIPPTETFEYMVFEKDSATDFTVISNPMTVATYIQQNPVDAILVGALHICASTGYALTPAGTYQLACIAQGHGVPFYVVAPLASISTSTQTDDWNVDANTVPYNTKDGHCLTSQANPTVCSWNPILDVTPASFITAIVTEQGVIQKEQNHDATFPIMKFIDENGGRILSSISTLSPEVTTLKNASLAKRISGNFIRFTVHSIVSYLETNCPQVMEELGATTSFNVTAKEIGTGEFNLVFIVTNKADTEKKVIAKQALPVIESAGSKRPLTIDRSYFEYQALLIHGKATSSSSSCHVPKVFCFVKELGLLVMEYFHPPNLQLRRALIQNLKYPSMAQDIGRYCAHTLFKTSTFSLTGCQLRKNVETWSKNSEVCAWMEQIVFTEPYTKSHHNRWTSPSLDKDKREIESDVQLKLAVLKLKNKYITENQALLHGNLHTGSILVSSGKTVVLGPTCAVYGPMGFDTGSFIANLLLNYVSQTVLSSRADGVINSDGNYGEWVLSEVNVFWETFCSEFLNLWNDQFEHTGDAFQRVLLHGKSSTTMPLHFAKDEFLSELLEDTLGFAGIEMLRRLFGSAHVEDLECIGEVELRVQCERHGLEIAKELIKNASKFKSINVVTMMACDKQRYMWGVPDENIDEKIEGDCAILTGLSMSFSTLEDGINFNKPIQYSDLDKNPTAISFSDDEEHECINVGPVEV